MKTTNQVEGMKLQRRGKRKMRKMRKRWKRPQPLLLPPSPANVVPPLLRKKFPPNELKPQLPIRTMPRQRNLLDRWCVSFFFYLLIRISCLYLFI